MSTGEIIAVSTWLAVACLAIGWLAWLNGYWTGQRDEARRQVEERRREDHG